MRNLPPINKIHLNTNKLLKDLLVGGVTWTSTAHGRKNAAHLATTTTLGHRDTRFSTPYPSSPKSLSRVTFNAAHLSYRNL